MWAALPPCVEDPDLLCDVAGAAEPLIDLRFGTREYKSRLVDRLVAAKLPGLTVCVEAGEELLGRVLESPPPNARMILCAPWDDAELSALLKLVGSRSVAVGAEVSSLTEASLAARLGGDFVVASGVEAAGPVSAKTSFILLQELPARVGIPVVIRGGLGPRGAAAAYALGAAGTILDSQLLLAANSGLSEALRAELAQRSASDTEVIGELAGRPFRLMSLAGKDAVRASAEREWQVFSADLTPAQRARAFREALEPVFAAGFSAQNTLAPVGQGLAFAQQFARRGWSVRQILEEYRRVLAESISRIRSSFPFLPDSLLAREHGVRYPIVQGPMALVTDTPKLAVPVAKAGALPFCATAGLKVPAIRELLREARETLGDSPFGAGIIGFLPLEGADDAVFGDGAVRPDFVTIAGGNPAQATRLEEAGIRAYVHAPSQPMIRDFLDHGVKGIILEGHEAGGHVGNLGSLVLWELAVSEILARPSESVAGMRVLFAGGIMTARSSLAAAVIAAPLAEHGVLVGLQAGTAYLMTEDAVACGAVPREYQQELLAGHATVLTGTTVNLPNRWLESPAVRQLLFQERELAGHEMAYRDRKHAVEGLGSASLAAALGRQAGADGACVCGQGIAVQEESWSIGQLHEALTTGAAELAARCPQPSFEEEMPAGAVAIVGMGCVFPEAPGLDEFWDNILQKRYLIREIPAWKWDTSLYYNEDRSLPEKTYSKIASFIEGFRKDALKFRIPPRSEPHIDTVQFMVLEAAYQALVDAGYLRDNQAPSESALPRAETSVFVGHGSETSFAAEYGLRTHWVRFADAICRTPEFAALDPDVRSQVLLHGEEIFKSKLPQFSEDTCAGVFSSLVAGRVANCFDLKGPAVVSDAACASALAAVDSAVESLRRRQCDVALAGAADVRVDPSTFVFFCSLGGLSAKGSFPFDERADGFVLGEGSGMLVLKRLEDAQRDGDRIYALIRAVGSSSDGRVKGITAPDVDGQIRAFKRAYDQVPFSPATVSLIEAHGTGTWAGDKAEVTSIGRFFGEHGAAPQSIGVGSVKSMIGHLKTAAGIAGLIKAIMALHTRIMPPTIHCEQPRKDVDWSASPCYLLTEPRLWEAGPAPRRAGVNAFGFGGINFHVVLEEAPVAAGGEERIEASPAAAASVPAELFMLRAGSRQELAARARELRARVAAGTPDLRELALSALDEDAAAGPCLALVAKDAAQLASHLDAALDILADPEREEVAAARGIYFREKPLGPGDKIAFLFPGQGAQYPGMLAGIPEAFPFVEPAVMQVDSIARRHVRTSIMSLLRDREGLDEETRQRNAALLFRPDYNHPAMLAMSMALGEVLDHAGIHPDMVAGHSLGEYGALSAAGVFDAESAIRITTQRGSGIAAFCLEGGAMASVGLSDEEVPAYLEGIPGFVAVANKNCPAQTVISGEKDAVEAALAKLEEAGVGCTRLPLAAAFHSRLLEPCVEGFRRVLSAFPVHAPRLPVQSNLLGRAYEDGEGFAERLREALVRHMVEPVNFRANIESMYEAGARLFIEVGPGSTLASFVDNTLGDRPHWTIATNIARRQPALQLLHAIAFCAALGLHVDVPGILPPRRARRKIGPSRRPAGAHASPQREAHEGIAVREAAGLPAPQPAAAGLLEAAFTAEDGATVTEYLAERGDFLRQMAAVDFAFFRKSRATGSATAPEAKPAASADTDGELARRVVEMVARKTGYPTDLIRLDLDVEAELGLDSIKQVEIVRELAQQLGLDPGSDKRSGGYQITTLRELIRRFADAMSAASPVVQPSPASAAAGPAPAPAAAPAITAEPEPEVSTDCSRLASCPVETPLPGPVDAGVLRGKQVTVLGGDAALATAVRQRLEAAGAVLGDDITGGGFVVSLGACVSRGLPALAGCAGWWAGLTAEATGLLAAAQKCAGAAATDGGANRWVAVSTLGGEFGAKGLPAFAPWAGPAAALGRCLAAESAGRIHSLCLDFEPSTDAESIASAVCEEMARDWDDHEIGYRGGKRYAIRWAPAAPGEETRLSLNDASVVLAIGGARGITAAVCEEVARRSGARFIIAGQTPAPEQTQTRPSQIEFAEAREQALRTALEEKRQPSPAEVDREAWQTVWAAERRASLEVLCKLASEVEYRQCDLLDPDSVRELVHSLRERYGRIDLVLQGAGALSQKTIPHFSATEFAEGMAPKALGTAHLLAALEGVEVGAFVNLSSIAGRWGNAGQASYAAGHEVAAILTASASATRSGRWFNVYYGPWLRTGMTGRGPIMERLHGRGLAFIRREEGAGFTADEVERGSGESVAYCGGNLEAIGIIRAAVPAASPLFDRLDVPEPGVAHGQREFDPARDSFVADHQVADGVPVVPGWLFLEMMAQAAAVLAEYAWRLTEIADAEFVRAGKFPQGQPRTFHVRARLLDRYAGGASLAGEVYTLFTPPGSDEKQEVMHARCRMKFGQREPAPVPSLVVPRSGLGHAVIDAAPAWDTKAFSRRKGLWRNIASVLSVGPEGAWGESAGASLPEAGKSQCLGDLVSLDGGLLLASITAATCSDINSYYLTGIHRIQFFDPVGPGANYLCRVRVSGPSVGEGSCMEAIGEHGRVAVRVTRSRRAPAADQVPADEPFWHFLREYPPQRKMRELLGIGRRLSLAQVDIATVAAALEEDAATLAGDFLCSGEQAHFEKIEHPKRRKEWLAGRIAAKSAIRMLLAPDPPEADTITVLPGEDGAPRVVVEAAGTEPALFVSIAHSSGLAVALATMEPGFGVDVEAIGGVAAGIEVEFARPEETALLERAIASREAALTCLWTAKEACRKALGASGTVPLDLVLSEANVCGEYVVCVFQHPTRDAVRSLAFHDAEYAYAVAGPAQGVEHEAAGRGGMKPSL